MIITLRKITNECYNNPNSRFYKKCGNYEVLRNHYLIIHKYYGSTICIVNLNSKQFSLYSNGYNSRLTTSQLNYLKEFYKNKKFKLRFRN